jgi:hypothetical protein
MPHWTLENFVVARWIFSKRALKNLPYAQAQFAR